MVFPKLAKGTGKIFRDQSLMVEGSLEDVIGSIPGYGKPDLCYLAMKGNRAAINALDRENYKINDAPFYYAKMGNLGYFISHKDFEFVL